MSTIDPTQFHSKEALAAELMKKAQAEADSLWHATEKSRRLANLHQELGYRTTRDLISALQQISGGAASSGKKKEGKRTRTTITDAIRSKVKDLAAAGKKAPSIAKEVGISTPTVYKIIG